MADAYEATLAGATNGAAAPPDPADVPSRLSLIEDRLSRIEQALAALGSFGSAQAARITPPPSAALRAEPRAPAAAAAPQRSASGTPFVPGTPAPTSFLSPSSAPKVAKAPTPPTTAAKAPSPAVIRAAAKPFAEQHSVAVLGVRGHGRKHIENFLRLGDCRISYICDVDLTVGEEGAAYVEQLAGYRPKVVQDFRVALDDPSVEAVSIATPHHWHALATIWALQAGKHVYLEKPISHTFSEGESIIAAARKYGRVVQCGTQLRSNTSLRAAGEFIQSGRLGDVKIVHCIVYKPRPPIPSIPVKAPSSVDYDLWCGPASNAPPKRGRFHYSWHWFWEYGNGALGNNGIHRIDAARIGMGLKGFGDSTMSFGGRFGPDDGAETPNTQIALHRFGDTWIIQEILGMPTPAWKTVSNGIIFYGAGNTIIYHKGGASLCDASGQFISRFDGKQEDHYSNFVRAMEANDPQSLTGDLFEGHVSSGLCHLGNISYRVGKPSTDAEVDAALDAMEAPAFGHETLARVRAHLTKHKVNAPLTLGRTLKTNPENGAIIGDEEAVALTRRVDRPPYVVPAPDKV
ncbi:MAG TPA: Gfo/Idh/MocA family oxidoreductase [Hansschlegelia sp.]